MNFKIIEDDDPEGENMQNYTQYIKMKSVLQQYLLDEFYNNKESKNHIQKEKNLKIFFFILKQLAYLNVPKRQISHFNEYINK